MALALLSSVVSESILGSGEATGALQSDGYLTQDAVTMANQIAFLLGYNQGDPSGAGGGGGGGGFGGGFGNGGFGGTATM